jgi:hypothetical protein
MVNGTDRLMNAKVCSVHGVSKSSRLTAAERTLVA